MTETNRRVVLAARPHGLPREADFRIEDTAMPAPAEGQILVRNVYVSVDPGIRARLGESGSYARPLGLGEVVEGATVGQLVAGEHPKFAVGDWVAAAFGWQQYATSDGRGVRKLDTSRVAPSTAIGVLGIPGLSASFGLLDVGRPQPGETVLVSSAAGAVGTAVGQIAAIKGARAVGIAGGAAKCKWLVDEMGFAAAIDYKAEPDLAAAIARECPEGVDVYFDNVGGAMLDTVLTQMKLRGRIVVCGLVGDANAEAKHGLLNTHCLVTHRLRMEGMLVFDYAKDFRTAWAEMTDWIVAGKLKYREDIDDGIDNLPRAFIGLFSGANFGRKLVKVG